MDLENPQSKIEDLEILVKNLPDSDRNIGIKALELCKRDYVSMRDYTREMYELFPELTNKEETKKYKRNLLVVLLMAEREIAVKEGCLAY